MTKSNEQKYKQLPELIHLENIIALDSKHLQVEALEHVVFGHVNYPIYALSLGNLSPQAPTITFVGGIHGVERIGTQVILAFLENIVLRLQWDLSLKEELSHVRMLFLPLMNPVGMLKNQRANGNNVDIMRNAPYDPNHKVTWMVGGQHLSPKLPWYRGKKHDTMELETQVLTDYIQKNVFQSPFNLVLDCHSGFGFNNRIWFPYAHSRKPIKHVDKLYRINKMLVNNYPHQDYIFESQSGHYTTNGDVWDFLYQLSLTTECTFLPLTLEMGSWKWIKKNPLQVFKSSGIFHPTQPHRVKRVLRQHHVFMEFLVKVTRSHTQWSIDDSKEDDYAKAVSLWYKK